jgi:membrane fusion protein (multidrug efflux system)
MTSKRPSIPGAVMPWLVAALLSFSASGLHADSASETVDSEVDVQVGQVVRTTLRSFVVAYGMVEPEPASGGRSAASARIASPVPGVIAVARCAEGEQVEKGAELFRLDTRAADVAITKTQAAVDFAATVLARQQRLLRIEGTSQKLVQESQQQLDLAQSELAAAKAQRALLSITAPLSGVAVRVNVKPGEAVDLTTVLAEVIDLDRLVVTANIPSAELLSVAVGQPVELAIGGRPSSNEPDPPPVAVGTVSFIGQQIDPRTDTAPVRINVARGAGLRPGQFVNVRIVTEERRDRLAVPIESVVKTDAGMVVAIVDGDRSLQKPVTVGLRDRHLAEVAGDGLREGMTVVTQGAYGLPKETKVRVVAGDSPDSSILHLAQTIELPDVHGGLDQMAIDVAGQRLFVAAQDNHTLEVVDLRSGTRVRSVGGFNEPKWIVYRPESQRLYVSTAGDGKVAVLDARSFALITSFAFEGKANNLRFDPGTGQLFVGVGKTVGGLGIIDTHADSVIGTIALASPPKQFELDGARIYVNEPAANQVAVVNRDRRTTSSTWPVLPATDNDPMALDRVNQRLLVGGKAGSFAVLDTASGAVVASLDINSDPDGIHYDAVRHLIYVSCGAGSIDVIQQTGADGYRLIARVPTAPGAATSLFVPELDRLVVAMPGNDGQPAAIRLYQARS